ncbi:Zinc finger, CCHC-type [Sesbania bispinosa]|nr:Zinc finger, CCHC-type [Sesbania bispinosa]
MDKEAIITAPAESQNSEDLIIELESDGVKGTRLTQCALVGKIFSNKALNKGVVKSILSKAWGEPLNLQITDMGVNVFLFNFNNKKEGLCFHCGMIGHEQKECKEEKKMSSYNPLTPKYGPRLGIPPTKSITSVFHDQQAWRNSKTPSMEEAQQAQPSAKKMAPTEKKEEEARNEQPRGDNTCQDQISGVGSQQHSMRENPTAAKNNQGTQIVERIFTEKGVQEKDMGTRPFVQPAPPKETQGLKSLIKGKHKEPLIGPKEKQPGYLGLATQINELRNTSSPNIRKQGEKDQAQKIQPTMIDLETHTIRVGLGPMELDQLQIHTEFIGLTEPQVILDCPSPPGTRYATYELTPAQIKKCKAFSKGYCHQGANKIEDGGYFVEFPEEDNIETRKVNQITPIQPEREQQLIVGWNKALTLKRRGPEYEDHTSTDNLEIRELILQRRRLGWLDTVSEQWSRGVSAHKNSKGEKTERLRRRAITSPTPAMSWISWNCRGLAAAPIIRELKDLCFRYKSSLIFLFETRAGEDKVKRLKANLKFPHHFCISPRDLSGGLCLFWDKSLDIEVTQASQNFIHAYVSDRENVKDWEVTFIYGNPNFQQRRNLWSSLSNLQLNSSRPWCCIGDFNEILSQAEKVGLHPQHQNRIDLFREFLNETWLVDMDLKGYKFTWQSNPRNGVVVKEKIDRVLVNWPWRLLYEDVMAMALPAIASDHSPIVLWPKPDQGSGNSFKYEAKLEEHEDCPKIVREGWEAKPEHEDKWENFGKKSRKCRLALQRWNSKTFKRADHQLFKLKEQLRDLQNQTGNEKNWKEIQEVRAQINNLWKQEEAYWAQRSRVKWLKHGAEIGFKDSRITQELG